MSELDDVKRIGAQPTFPMQKGHWMPGGNGYVENDTVPGLTLRQYAAVAAMHGLLARPNTEGSTGEYARDAVRHADALLAELAK